MHRLGRYRLLAGVVLLLGILGATAYWVKHHDERPDRQTDSAPVGPIAPKRSCAHLPAFLRKQHIAQPVMIDLSQKHYKGIAFRYGPDFGSVLHWKQWEQYEHFSTYALDRMGDIYLVPTPYISIRPTTFALQRKLYRLDGQTGHLEIFMDIESVQPSQNNPYGLNAIAYDCDDDTLWVATIDRSDYRTQRGVLHHIDLRRRAVLSTYAGFDALSLAIARTPHGKYLLAGSARDNSLYAFALDATQQLQQPQRLFSLPDPNQHIRKIKLVDAHTMQIESIRFTYALIAQTARQDRLRFVAKWDKTRQKWHIKPQ